MDFFIDTNVAVAFTFFPDKFHDSIKDFVLERYYETYWSNNVFKEYEKKYEDIYPQFENFLDCILLNLKKNNVGFINKYSFEKFIMEKTKYVNLDLNKKLNLIDIFWDEVISGVFKGEYEFLSFFENYSIYVPKLFESNDDFLKNYLNFYDCGLDNYKRYPKLLSSLKEMGVHNPDYKIILDAHDFARDRFVVFVSADKKFMNKLINFKGLDVDDYMLLN